MSVFKRITGFPAQPGAISSYYDLDLVVTAGASVIQAVQLDISTNSILGLYEFALVEGDRMGDARSQLSDLIREQDIFQKPYRHETIAFEYPYVTLVPGALFDERNIRTYLSACFHLPQEQVFMADKLDPLDIRIAYSLPETAATQIRQAFPGSAIRHYATPLLSGMAQQAKSQSGRGLFCHFRGNQFDLVAFEDGKLLFFNTFEFNNKEEFLYYVLFVLEQLGLNASEQEMLVSGDVEPDREPLLFARDFLKSVPVWKGLPDGIQSRVAGQPEWHRYIHLINLRLCV